MEELLVELT